MIQALIEFARMLVNPGSEIGVLINSIIALAVIFTGWKLLALGRLLANEQRAIKRVHETVKQLPDAIARGLGVVPDEGGDGEGSTEVGESGGDSKVRAKRRSKAVAKLLSGVDPSRLVHQRVAALARLRYAAPTAVEALAKVDEDEAHVRLSIPRYAATVPVLLGLMGTLWGLSTAVIEIQPLILQIDDLQDLPQLLGAMIATLSGMKTAFATSIAGLLAGIVLSLLATAGARRYQKVLRDLEHLTALELIPLLVLPPEARSLAAFRDVLDRSTRSIEKAAGSVETWTSTMIDAVNDTQAGVARLVDVANKFAESAASIARFQDDYQHQMLDQNAELRDTMDSVVEAVTVVSTTTADLAQQQRDAHEDMRQVLEDMKAVQGSTKTFVEELPGRLTGALEQLADQARQPFVDFWDAIRDKINSEMDESFDRARSARVAPTERPKPSGRRASSGGDGVEPTPPSPSPPSPSSSREAP